MYLERPLQWLAVAWPPSTTEFSCGAVDPGLWGVCVCDCLCRSRAQCPVWTVACQCIPSGPGLDGELHRLVGLRQQRHDGAATGGACPEPPDQWPGAWPATERGRHRCQLARCPSTFLKTLFWTKSTFLLFWVWHEHTWGGGCYVH